MPMPHISPDPCRDAPWCVRLIISALTPTQRRTHRGCVPTTGCETYVAHIILPPLRGFDYQADTPQGRAPGLTITRPLRGLASSPEAHPTPLIAPRNAHVHTSPDPCRDAPWCVRIDSQRITPPHTQRRTHRGCVPTTGCEAYVAHIILPPLRGSDYQADTPRGRAPGLTITRPLRGLAMSSEAHPTPPVAPRNAHAPYIARPM